MIVSTNVYAATVAGTTLDVRGGSITLDDSGAPHVEATIDISTPAPAVLALLDARTSPPPRVRVTAAQTVTGQQTRTRAFDLTLRGRTSAHRTTVMTLTLTSDEALVNDYAPLEDDGTAYRHMASLRAVVNYVLGKAIPGARLENTPALDADVSALENATNLSPNGGFRTNTSGWNPTNATASRIAGGPGVDGITHLARATFAAGQGGGWFNQGGEQDGATAVVVSSKRDYRTAIWVRSNVAVSLSLNVEWVNSSGAYIGASMGLPVAIPANTWTKLTADVTAPDGAARAGAYVYRAGGTWAAGNTLDIAGHRFSDRPESIYDLFQFFDGATLDTPHHGYAWTGAAGGSPSTRLALTGRSADMLLWEAGQGALDFLAPIVQVCGYRLVCDEQRRWTLRDEDFTAPDSITIRHGVNLSDGSDKVSRDDDLWFDAAVTIYEWTDENNVRHRQIDAYALTSPYTRLRTFERGTPYPGPGFSAYAVRRAQGRGREVTATAAADWRAQAEQTTSVVIDGAPIQTGRIARVTFDLDRDQMTITTRTTDTPDNAIVLLTGAIDQLVGTIDAL